MLSPETWAMIGKETINTLYMAGFSTLFGYVLGLPWGIVLAVTDTEGIRPNKVIYRVLDIITNIMRSIPFLILLILIIPLTRLIVGKSYGSTATIVPLVVSAAPFIARMVESSLKEVDHGVIEAAQAMGADTMTIITKVLLVEARISLIIGVTISFATILGYQYGYYRYQFDIMIVTVILLVAIVQVFQFAGMRLASRLDRRKA